MNTDLIRAAQTLDKGHLFRLHDALGLQVLCISGCLWVTQDGDPRDIVLEAGESFTIDRPGDALLSALHRSRFALLDEAPLPTHRPHQAARGDARL